MWQVFKQKLQLRPTVGYIIVSYSLYKKQPNQNRALGFTTWGEEWFKA